MEEERKKKSIKAVPRRISRVLQTERKRESRTERVPKLSSRTLPPYLHSGTKLSFKNAQKKKKNRKKE